MSTAGRQDAAAHAEPESSEGGIEREVGRELDRDLPWAHPWDLRPGVTTPVVDPSIRHVQWTRAQMIAAPVQGALAADDEPSALVVACREGWFCQRLADWGARRIVGVDADPQNVSRAMLMQRRFRSMTLPDRARRAAQQSARIEYVAARPTDLTRERPGRFTVVLLVDVPGLEADPAAQAGLASELSDHLAVLTAHPPRPRPAGRPDEGPSALEAALEGEGFTRLEWAAPPADGDPAHVAGERAILIAWRT